MVKNNPNYLESVKRYKKKNIYMSYHFSWQHTFWRQTHPDFLFIFSWLAQCLQETYTTVDSFQKCAITLQPHHKLYCATHLWIYSRTTNQHHLHRRQWSDSWLKTALFSMTVNKSWLTHKPAKDGLICDSPPVHTHSSSSSPRSLHF